MDKEKIKATMHKVMKTAEKVKKQIWPWLPVVARLLLVLTFIEDASRIFLELSSQISFLSSEYLLPSVIAGILIVSTTTISLAGSFLVITQKKEQIGAYLLIFFLFYQQVIYGRHSPIASGNIGFLFRNLCLAGCFLLLAVQRRIKEGQTALPGVPDAGERSTYVEYIQVAARCLLVLLSLEFLTTLGPIGSLLTLPVIGAVLVGYRVPVSGSLLFLAYFLHNVLNSAFWASSSEFTRDVKRYEFTQTLSIMGGILLLIVAGPGTYSVDQKMSRRKNW